MKFTRTAIFISVALVANIAQIKNADAQDNESKEVEKEEKVEKVEKVEKIIVTGQKFDRRLQEIPTSVAVLTNKQMENLNILDFDDALSAVPNVAMEPGTGNFQIRGINAFGVSGGGNSFLASMYLDGAPLPPNMIDGDLSTWDLQQIEVLRGPQSTLQGRNALAGAIVINTVEPQYEWGGKARIIMGQDGRQDLAIAGGGGFADEQIAIRISAEDRQHDGFNTNRFLNVKSDPNEDSTYRFKAKITPNALPDLQVNFTYTQNKNEAGTGIVQDVATEFAFNVDVPVPPYRTINQDTAAFNRNDNNIYNLAADYDINSVWTFTSATTYSSNQFYRERDGDQTPEPRIKNISDTTSDTFSQELRATFDYDNFKGIFGLFYSTYELENDNFGATLLSMENIGARDSVIGLLIQNGLPPAFAAAQADQVLGFYGNFFPVAISINTNVNRNVTNTALFTDMTYKISDSVEVFGGLRFDKEKQDNESMNSYIIDGRDQFPNPANFAENPLLAQLVGGINGLFDAQAAQASQNEPLTDASFNEVLPKIGLSYLATADMSVNLMYQKGYRSGGVGTNIAQGKTFTYDKEYSHNYELSYRSVWFDGDLTANANLFFVDWQDQQVDTQLSPNVFDIETQNAGESSIRGFELELMYRVTNSLTVNAGYGYAETNFETFLTNTDNPNRITRDLSGLEFADSSRITSNFAIQYANEGVVASLNANYKSKSRRLLNPWLNSTEIPGDIDEEVFFDPKNDDRWLVNARVGYNWGKYGVFLTAENLLDAEYKTFANATRRAAVDSLGTINLGQPRQIAVQFSAAF